MKRFLLICICIALLGGLCISFPSAQEVPEYRTLTVKLTDNWTDIYIYTWEPEELGRWPGTPIQKSADGYMIAIRSSMKNLIIHGLDNNGNYVETGTICLENNGRDATVYASIGAQPIYTSNSQPVNELAGHFYDLGSASDYRVVSSANWSTLAGDPVVLNDVGSGVYRKTFYDARSGEVGLQLQQRTENGTWKNLSNDDYVFTVNENGAVSVELTVKDEAVGILDIHGHDVVKPAPLSINLINVLPPPFESPTSLFPQMFLFGLLAVCVYLVFLLLQRNQLTAEVSPDGTARRRARLSEKQVAQAVKENMPMPSAELDNQVLAAIKKAKTPPADP